MARGRALGPVNSPHRGVRPQVLARYRTSVSTGRERGTRQCAMEGTLALKWAALPGFHTQLQCVT